MKFTLFSAEKRLTLSRVGFEGEFSTMLPAERDGLKKVSGATARKVESEMLSLASLNST